MRYRNLDVLRLVAASSVIFSHGFLIAERTEANEPFKILSGDILGLYGVYTFFIISGLLVTESWVSTPGMAGFVWRRFLRLYPAYLVCMAVTLTIAGLFFYPDGGLLDFLRADARTIVKHLAYLVGDGFFSGVKYYAHTADFSEGEVNGSIWSLQQEIVCYGLLVVFAAARLWKPSLLIAALLVSTLALYKEWFGPEGVLEYFFYAIPSFVSGALAWWLLKVHRPNVWIALACAAVIGAALLVHKTMFVFPPCAAYLILYLGVSAPFDLRTPRWLGDVSYGAYLYGWPVEQMVKIALGERAAWWQVFGLGLAGALTLGFISWRLIEKPALRLKGVVPADWSLDRKVADVARARLPRPGARRPASGT
ncbi:acyltransferase [Phenylobacterium sp.]|uniref:acyltransferase family protein n=1 Tax=Phenylobacterium sp. TaxID=1871053 RepID=UPI002F42FA30